MDGSSVVLKKVAPLETTYEQFLEAVPSDEARYFVYDYHYSDSEGKEQEKVVLISWVPDDCPARQRMVYAGTLGAVRSQLQGVSRVVQASDFDEISEAELQKKLK